ncbi:putative urease [Fusarium bulbicola]|nr:putative urease [Fusarium bulbicola]
MLGTRALMSIRGTGERAVLEKVGLLDQINAGVIALKLLEDSGCTPSTVDNSRDVCEEYDIQCHIHTHGLNEASFLEHTATIFNVRSMYMYHVEGAGSGHAPDAMELVAYANVFPSSTIPTMPFTTNTIDEHIDMGANCHRLLKDNPDDVSFLKNRIREETISTEDILHDIGAISIMSSDSQAMGRSTERYISKYTTNPAITEGISHAVGSVEARKLADLVIWYLAKLDTKAFQVLKKGFIAYARMCRRCRTFDRPAEVWSKLYIPKRASCLYPKRASQKPETFKTGTCLITIHDLISTDDGDLNVALYGSFLAVPSHDLFSATKESDSHPLAMPGVIRPADTIDVM